MSSENGGLGAALRVARQVRGMSLADLAGATYVSRGWINNVEAGRRWPARDWIEQVERALDIAETLLPIWDREMYRREQRAEVQKMLSETERESHLLMAFEPDAAELDRLGESAATLAVEYLYSAPRPMLERGRALRRELTRRLFAGAVKPGELADLYVALGRVSGVLAYAALDLGSPAAADTHGAAAWRMGTVSGNDELRAWARGTQSLIARFDKNYKLAKAYIDDGLQYAGAGTSEVRLLCGAAQCAANLGDSATALATLDEAKRARERARPDAVEGLLGFSPAKQAYYSASSLMWLPDHQALTVAERSAVTAIDIWEHEPIEQRSLDDEALAHVYLATARMKLGEIDGGMAAVRPVMDLPEERQISWIRKRIGELGDILSADDYYHSVAAADARDELRAFGAAS